MDGYLILIQRRVSNSQWEIVTARHIQFDEAERDMKRRMQRAPLGSWEYRVAGYKLDAVTAAEFVLK